VRVNLLKRLKLGTVLPTLPE